ncbi:MAG: hypothetical protein EOM19_02180 [Candidatus Moranbacteria bacterium]|nr:hypothetical protein [Candidatus Moranbacteria bacterium]
MHVALYILDKGIENIRKITDEDIVSFVKEREKVEEELKKENKFPVMTATFQASIINEAREICQKPKGEIASILVEKLKLFGKR